MMPRMGGIHEGLIENINLPRYWLRLESRKITCRGGDGFRYRLIHYSLACGKRIISLTHAGECDLLGDRGFSR